MRTANTTVAVDWIWRRQAPSTSWPFPVTMETAEARRPSLAPVATAAAVGVIVVSSRHQGFLTACWPDGPPHDRTAREVRETSIRARPVLLRVRISVVSGQSCQERESEQAAAARRCEPRLNCRPQMERRGPQQQCLVGCRTKDRISARQQQLDDTSKTRRGRGSTWESGRLQREMARGATVPWVHGAKLPRCHGLVVPASCDEAPCHVARPALEL